MNITRLNDSVLHVYIGTLGELASTTGSIHDTCANTGRLPVTVLLSEVFLSESNKVHRKAF